MRVRFDVAPDGSCQAELLTSTGNAELDSLTLATLRQWRWEPALRNGEPVSSVEYLRVEFLVE